MTGSLSHLPVVVSLHRLTSIHAVQTSARTELVVSTFKAIISVTAFLDGAAKIAAYLTAVVHLESVKVTAKCTD